MENSKNYIDINKNIEKYFFTGLKEKTLEQKYSYLKDHFTYNIMNSWNCLKTISNKVKIYSLGFNNEQTNKFFELLEICDGEDLYFYLNNFIYDFEKITNTKIYYNGRSGGYLILIDNWSNRNQNILDCYNLNNIEYYNTFKEYKKENVIENDQLIEAYLLCKAFDKLCDVIRENLIYLLANATIETEEILVTQTIKRIAI